MKRYSVLAVALHGLLTVGCDARPAAGDPPAAQTAALTTETLIAVVVDDAALRAPGRLPGGPALVRFLNRGGEPHRVRLLRLAPGRSAAELRDRLHQAGQLPPWARPVAESGTLEPGAEAAVRLLLRPGRYVLLCTLASPGGRSHLRAGLIRVLQVA